MEGVLEGACALGVCKLACSLFFLPAFSDLISFCCCCLLMFTDLLVTGFLLFLWFADPWPPQLSPRGDLIALRFLLFVGRTYAAVLLLTTPLIAAETALRKVWPCDDGGAGAACRTADGEGCKALERSVAIEKSDAHRGPDKWRRLSHAIGYPCCLSVWMVSGLWGGCRGRSLEELWVAECLHTRDSLFTCLPRMFPGPVEPFWGVAFLGLLLLLSIAVELSARVRQEKRGTGVAEDNNNNKSNSWQRLVPALVRPSPPTSEPRPATEPTSVDPEKTSMTHQRPDPDPPAPGSAPGDPGRETETGPAGRPQRVVPGTGRIVTTGLVGMLSLYTLPLTLSVNVLLVHTMQDVVEVCVETCVAQRRWRGEAKSSILKT